MKIAIFHQYYLMPGFSGGSRFNEFARLWSDAGHDVTVIAGNLDYSTGRVPTKYAGRLRTLEEDGKVRVWRCHVPKAYTKSYLGRMWAFAGFTLSAATTALRLDAPDVIIATSPPLVIALPAWAAWALRRKRPALIFEIRDLWPESAVTTGVLSATSPLTKFLYALEKWACKSAARINVLTPAFRDDLVRRGLAPAAKIVLIPNGADVSMFQPANRNNAVRQRLAWGDRFVVLYAGAHGRANALQQLIEAAALLRDRPDILIACVGDGAERNALVARARAENLTNIVFYGAFPKEDMPTFVQACDAGTAVLQRNPTFHTVYPNKVFDYMACERPVLLGIDGVARTLVCERAQAGLFAEPEDANALAAGIRALADDAPLCQRLGTAGRRWVLANATREALATQYLAVMEELVQNGPAAGPRSHRSQRDNASGATP